MQAASYAVLENSDHVIAKIRNVDHQKQAANPQRYTMQVPAQLPPPMPDVFGLGVGFMVRHEARRVEVGCVSVPLRTMMSTSDVVISVVGIKSERQC
jgi:hypothetical protein